MCERETIPLSPNVKGASRRRIEIAFYASGRAGANAYAKAYVYVNANADADRKMYVDDPGKD